MTSRWMLVGSCLLVGLLCGASGAAAAPPAAPPAAPLARAPATASAEAGATLPDPPLRQPWTITAYWENDGGPLKRNHLEDRYYTEGLGLSFDYKPRWADRLADVAPFADAFGPARTGAGFVVGQLIFTPADITKRRLQVNDRPYAGYLFAGVFWERANDQVLDHAQVDVGLVGQDSGAEALQKIIHRNYNGDKPEGWSHQLKDEPTIQVYLRRKWRLALKPVDLGHTRIQTQLIPQVGLALGTVYRYAQTGALFRVGVNLPDDFGPGRLADVRSAVGGPNPGWTAYGYFRASGRVVEHNMFLDGNTFRESHSIEKQPLVGELQLGVAVGYRGEGWATQLTYSQTTQTEAFVGQNGADGWGALTIGYTGSF